MTIREQGGNNENDNTNEVRPSAPSEEELYSNDNRGINNNNVAADEVIVVHAEPVYPNDPYQQGQGDDVDIPFVPATSVVSEQYPYANGAGSLYHSNNHSHNSASIATHQSQNSSAMTHPPIAVATGPARPSTSFATATGPALPPRTPTSTTVRPSSVQPQQQQIQQQQPTVHYATTTTSNTSRYRDRNGALTCCGISLIITVSLCICCALPAIIVFIVYAASWQYMTFEDDDIYDDRPFWDVDDQY